MSESLKMKYMLFECHDHSRVHDTVVADVVVVSVNINKAVRNLSDQMRKHFTSNTPSIEIGPTSASCSYIDHHDGLSYQREFTLVDSFSSEEEANNCKQAHHDNWNTIHFT